MYSKWIGDGGGEMTKEIPLIKEYRIQKLIESLKCIDKFAYYREKQRDCILKLYLNSSNKSIEHREKSIFRGMVIPSLRYLGLIIGFGDSIKPSANGKLIIESQFDNELHGRCLRAITYEIDKKIFEFLSIITKNKFSKKNFIAFLSEQVVGISDKQKKERIKKWLSILYQVKLIEFSQNDIIEVNEKNYKQVISDTNPELKDFTKFCEYCVDEYYNLGKNSAGIVDIRDLRENVGIRFLKERRAILTESQFDYLFSRFIFTTQNFHVSLGEPMGADQKLFEYKGKFYKTVIMRKKRGN